jgi:hypothetical protein
VSGDEGKDIRAAGLDAVAHGITLTLAELKEIGVDSMAGAGRGFSELSLSGLQLGHEALTTAPPCLDGCPRAGAEIRGG